MKSVSASVLFAAAVGAVSRFEKRASSYGSSDTTLLTDMSVISRSWGQISTYGDNPDNYFGVQEVGLPDGCGIEQVHSLQRHAQRFPTSSFDDGINDEHFGAKVFNYTSAKPEGTFSGPLAFLNTYKYIMGESYLTGIGAQTEFASGVQFWNKYGRLLYNTSLGQLAYNASYSNGTARPKPLLRTTSQSRIWNSQINWALGFFGPSFQETPSPLLTNWTSAFDVLIIPEGGTENNTLAAYDSCKNDNSVPVEDIGDLILLNYLPIYLTNATQRLKQYVPSDFDLTINDTYAMQSICAYESGFIGSSDFCGLFTADEWSGFEQTLDIEYYYDYAYGNPTGRAQGIGYVSELLARLTNTLITSSNTSVNASLDNNAKDFPLGRPFYLDVSHDDIIISVLTALSMDYFKDAPDVSAYPPKANRSFILSHLTPFGGRLHTEVIGCSSANPMAKANASASYYAGQNGYSKDNATHKFIRMRLNSGILPIASIRGGKCAGRTDGLCSLSNFEASQADAYELANYQYACLGNYSISNVLKGVDYDGTIYANGTL